MLAFTICAVLLMGLSGMVSATAAIDGTVGYSADREDKYTPSVSQSQTVKKIRLGVWWPRYGEDLPPYSDLAAAGIEASDVVNLTAYTLPNYDVIYIGRGAFHLHAGEGYMDVEEVKEWVGNGGAIIGESESVIYDSVYTLGVDWSPQLSYACGVWSTEADAGDYGVGDITVTLNPEHPISNGLPDTFSTTVYSMECAAYLDLGRNPTAHEVGTVESSLQGIPPIVASSYGSGRAVYFPYCPDGETDWSSTGGHYLEHLFINAVKWAAGEVEEPLVSIATDRDVYYPGDTIIRHLEIDNPTANPVTFNWYLGVPQFTYWGTIVSTAIPAGFSYSGDLPFPVGDWGPTPFGMVWYVELTDGTDEVLDSDAATCAYSPGIAVSRTLDVVGSIEKSIKKAEQ